MSCPSHQVVKVGQWFIVIRDAIRVGEDLEALADAGLQRMSPT